MIFNNSPSQGGRTSKENIMLIIKQHGQHKNQYEPLYMHDNQEIYQKLLDSLDLMTKNDYCSIIWLYNDDNNTEKTQ